ncbi:hypothetical protein EMIHUDRAFT_216481 [Emiliania huxleyi CCMP1516]|uniref:Uncharacterized protein n=2 Tax=Emiliania huxleyi TaxID=2903 RepID=A0A0D3IF14_EMIH1|nr:hypothetical protein EMIHUDRAFT_216481 [Emiliania huxleyi CCMP1516]EOD09849.1 hypothetical protein EMIHUDRAFT_216481 [Emiliania huxleyi CCMP1516]|eukprot:XP_005762278.1 hypothetical protein EMIHUDRAFT_216481 [Emiliania huxleyi CCMP1516]
MLAVLLPLSALSALPALLPLSALALPTLSTARAPIGGETPFVGARAGVIATLFPGLGKPLQRLLGGEQGFTAKRRAVLRWRIAERRAEVERCSRELEALAAREYRAGRPEAPAVRVARQERVAQLRRAAGQAEASILRYKARLGAEERPGWLGVAARAAETFTASEERSARVLWTRLRQADPWDALRQDAASLLRLGSNVTLARGYLQLSSSSRLVPHAAAIVARAAKLERILELVEPHLDEVLQRFDQIEPHLPFVLDHVDVLAPHVGVILKHFDALLLYVDQPKDDLASLVQYLPIFAPLFDTLGPNIALAQPHIKALAPHLSTIAPHAARFAPYCAVSANADVLLWYFGWVLRLPLLRHLLLSLPAMPRIAAFLARRLPRRPCVRSA